MIKRIQLRGITRTPSDRGTADGGCAESINVHLDQNETAPTLPPIDITEDVYARVQEEHLPIYYIHKMSGTVVYIGFGDRGQRGIGFAAYLNGELVYIGNDPQVGDETLVSVTSLGNTLIAFTDAKPYYFLYQEGQYTFLGNAIPRPMLEIVTRPLQGTAWSRLIGTALSGWQRTRQGWADAINESDDNHASYLSIMDTLWGEVKKQAKVQREGKVFVAPFFIRYALKLYSGEYIHLSTPILCGAGANSEEWMKAFIYTPNNPEGGMDALMVQMRETFEVRVKGEFASALWGDIVSSIDIFASTPIYTPKMESLLSGLSEELVPHPEQGQYAQGYDFIFKNMADAERDAFIKEEVLSKGQFYKIMSIDIKNADKMSALAGGKMKIENSDLVSGDELLVQDVLKDGYRDGNQYLPINGSKNYNSRTTLIGAKEILSRGDAFINGQVMQTAAQSYPTSYSLWLRFKIVDPSSGDASYVMEHYHNGSKPLRTAVFLNPDGEADASIQKYGDEAVQVAGATYNASRPFAWICYPDSRCKQVEIAFNQTKFAVIPMEEHPLLECSYAFFGMEEDILANFGEYELSDFTEQENPLVSQPNKLFQSAFENPFLFPAEGIITFKDALIDTAMTSVPLSEGQLGQFEIYAFTEGGIRVLSVASDGTILSNNAKPNLAGYVALPGSVLALEQAVVFSTKRGVMLLQGSSVTDLSAAINGRPTPLDDPTDILLDGTDWEDIKNDAFAGKTLMGFMEGAKPAYDHNGNRLIFLRDDERYAYVYKIDTATWHKIGFGAYPPDEVKVLNSYPDCLVCATDGLSFSTKVLNFSTILDDEAILSDATDPVYGIVMTRPFDLDAPDVRKTISDLRVRGVYNRGDVQYILQGSFDGLHWQRLTSLRGGSYKLFRLILLTKLTPMERITWVDIEYETRFQNKLR